MAPSIRGEIILGALLSFLIIKDNYKFLVAYLVISICVLIYILLDKNVGVNGF